MDVFRVVKDNVTARQVAEHYGMKIGRNGMACCPFHDDKHPSMKLDKRYYCSIVLDVEKKEMQSILSVSTLV